MRVNIIGKFQKGTGLAGDAYILHGMIVAVLGKEIEVRHIPVFYPHCQQAEVNFFLESINPSLFAYARKNIWIPNHEWTYQTWKPYANMVDEIWVKTREAEKIFLEWTENVKYIGWTSIDKIMPEIKNFHQAIVPVGKNIWRNPKPIFQAYDFLQKNHTDVWEKLPHLHIVYRPDIVPLPPLPENIKSKITLHDKVLSEEEYDELLHSCGVCICMSAAEGFGHAVNEAMSAGCITMLSPIDAFRELTDNAYWVSQKKATPHPQCLGILEDVDVFSLVDALTTYTHTSYAQRKQESEDMRTQYEGRHHLFVERMKEHLGAFFKDIPDYSLEAVLPKEEELPFVSLITITRDRRRFLELAKYCYMAQSYPPEKLEWVIVDDGKDQIKDLITDMPNVKYVLLDDPVSIGAKRNIAVQNASHNILVVMDDDDVYPNNSVLTRVAHMLATPSKECLFSTTIPCYHIQETKSFMNVPPTHLGMSERVSEATLCFTRRFWEARNFPDQQIAEGGAFVKDREEQCRECSPQEVIVSLVHGKNTSSRKPPPMESNGCHYGFSDDLFTLVSEIGES